MRLGQIRRIMIASAGATALSACGGGGGGGISFIPAPPVTPTPTPNPTPGPTPAPVPPPIPAGPIGLQSSAAFATVAAYDSGGGKLATGSALVQFAYSAATDRYTITLPGYDQGQLVTEGGSGSFDPANNVWIDLASTTNGVTDGNSSSLQSVKVVLDWPGSSAYKYTGRGSWVSPVDGTPVGLFAYGIPTAAGDVPLSGTATYLGSVEGIASNTLGVGGSVSLSFDFGAGSLTGIMKPTVAPTWDAYSLGDYTFRDTSFAKGATTFSGSFEVSGSTAPSSFQGSFNGPQAAELMAHWTAPYLNPETKQWGTMTGIWIAKKP